MEDSPLVISYKSKLYDLTKFQHKHPGGLNTLKGLNNTDMEERFDRAPPHSDAAMYLMKEYEVEHTAKTNNNGIPGNGYGNGYDNGHANGHANGHTNGIGNGSLKSKDINSNLIQSKTDESMEVSAMSSYL